MTIEELISFLGYAGSPHFLRRDEDGRFETELGCGHVFRRAIDPINPKSPSWRLEGVYGLRDALTTRFTPVIYVCTAKDESAAGELHRLLWNQDIAPFIIVHTHKGIGVYSGFCYSPQTNEKSGNSGVIAALDDFEQIRDILAYFRRSEIDEGCVWQQPKLRIDVSQRVHQKLLESLRELDKSLQKGGLAKVSSHALIGRYVYLHYLRDRGILSPERLARWHINPQDIFSRNAKKDCLETLTKLLDDWLNGEIFPIVWQGNDSPSTTHIQAVAGVFCGDQHGASAVQLHLNFAAYDFAFIPIETLSLVYEQFLHADGINDAPSTGRSEGAYYTPLPLVNFVLAALERQHPLRKGMKVFDPSSGSGAFLVQAYRLLIEKTYPSNKARPKPSELRELLISSIFGCDVDADACQVTQLSLILTLLDYVDPPDLTGPMHSFRLPTLVKSNNQSGNDHAPNILQQNFFGIEPELAAAVARKHGASVDWRTQGFDWIVGNPPWKNLNPKKLGINDPLVWEWMKANAKMRPIGNHQAAQAFAWEAPKYLKRDGECALLVPAMGLFEDLSIAFRTQFFQAFQVHEVANFSNLAEVLFEGRARVPTASISYRLRHEHTTDDHVTVYSPFVVNQPASCPAKEGLRGKIWNLSIDSSEISVLNQREIATGSGLPWKIAMWGSAWDQRLLNRLERKWPKLESLEGVWDSANRKYVPGSAGEMLGISQGLEYRVETGLDSKVASEPEKALIGAVALSITALNRLRHIFSFPAEAKVPLPNQDHYVRGGTVPLAVCKPPHIIVSAARNFAVYSDEFLIVPARQIGIVSCTQDKDFLKALSLYLSSDFAFYHQFFKSTQFGIQRARATLESLRAMPVPLLDLSHEKLLKWTDLHSKLLKCEPRKLGETTSKSGTADLFGKNDDQLDSLLAQLNQMTGDALGLSAQERTLIHDFVHVRYALNDGKRGDAAMRKSSTEELLAYAQMLKCELDEFVGPDAGRSHRITIVYDAETALVEIDFTTELVSAKTPQIVSAASGIGRKIKSLSDSLTESNKAWQWAYFNRNLRLYRGRCTYVVKPLHRFRWTQSAALTDAGEIICETLSGAHD